MTIPARLALRVVLLAAVTMAGEAAAQEGKLTIRIRGDARFAGRAGRVAVDGGEQRVRFDRDGIAVLTVPGDSTVRVEISSTVPGDSTVWTFSGTLNGSGHLLLNLNETGGVNSREWPAVRFRAQRGRYEVWVNRKRIGYTARTAGIRPNKPHVLRWRRNGGTVCMRRVTLPFNEGYDYTCNSDGTVTVIRRG